MRRRGRPIDRRPARQVLLFRNERGFPRLLPTAGDWRASSDVFHGAAYEGNLKVVDDLRTLAVGELGITLGQLAVER